MRGWRMRAVGILVAGIGALALVGCGDDGGTSDIPAVTVERPTAPMSQADARAIDREVRVFHSPAARRNFPALWIGVWDPEKGVFTRAYGSAVREGGVDATPEDVLRIGSITKTFTATVVLQLVDEGRLSLDDTVAEVHPDLAERFPRLGPLTIRQLLAMRSGLADYLNGPDGAVPQVTGDPQHLFSADDLIATGVEASTDPPGSPGYSSTNYIVLQEIAEHVTGESIEDLIASRATHPLGMSDATLLPRDGNPELADPASHGYLNTTCVAEIEGDGGQAAEGTDTSEWNVSYGQAAGGMSSTVDDLGIWAASVSGNALLSDDLARRRLRTSDIGGIRYGLGVMKVGDWYGHEGEALGWEALVLHNPGTGVSLAMATNACAGAPLLFIAIAESLYPGTGLGELLG